MALNPAERVPLGRSGLQVTRMGLGCAPIGGLFTAVAEADALGTVERAWQHGLRFFDTAPLYGHGSSELRLGQALRGKPREEYVVATKVGRVLQPREGAPPADEQYKETAPYLPVFDFSAEGIRRSHRESLQRLGMDRVDVLHIHDPDKHFPQAMAESYPVLDGLRRGGAIQAVGAGMNQAQMCAEFARQGQFDCFLLAGRYTLLDQIGLEELLPLCEQKGIAIIAAGVYNSGILATGAVPDATYDYKPAPPEMLEKTRRLEALAARFGIPLKAAALQFPLGHPAVATVVSGARTPTEIEENVTLFRTPIPAGFWQALRDEGLIDARAPLPQE